ncbi:ABC transporter permease [Halosegnis longus]|uniref:ABC transporter permease n=1 Tax=Halosegnis longus TaxID=2216012 RepID=A0AAJ4R895_9EURY|nr:ABC transporter permease [Halosegnis longus]RNJ26119.1 ABC transporter permease [Salella cibi]
MSARDRIERALTRLVTASTTERFAISLAALFASILVGTVLILGAGRITECATATFVLTHPTPFGLPRLFEMGFCYNPVTVYDRLFLGALGDPLSTGWDPFGRQMALTLRETTVLLFTGLGVAVAFRAGIFNIGAQGQLVVGSLASALAVLQVAPLVGGIPGTVVSLTVGLAVGALAGGLYAAVPGLLKAYADANEVITTIMLNFIATGVVGYLVLNHVKDPDSFATQTRTIPDHANFPTILFDPSANFSVLALAVGVVLVGVIYYLLAHTAFGYDVRTSGLQPEAAEYGGVDAKRTIVASFGLSGALAGVGGALYALMILGKFQTGVPSYGFDGITVSILAGNNPLGVGFAAFLFGILKSGAGVVNFATEVPPQLVATLRGLIILFVAMPEFFRLLGGRMKGVQRRLGREQEGGETDA